MTGGFSLDLLGGFRLRAGSSIVPVSSKKDRFLLARLALAGGSPLTREKLCGFLWGDRAEAQARASLRQSLVNLRASFGQCDVIIARQEHLQLDPSLVAVDVLAFQAAAADAEPSDALRLYRGILLDELEAPAGEAETWLRAERRRLEDMAEALIAAASRGVGVSDDVLGKAKAFIQRNPLSKSAHRTLMRMHIARGERSQALAAYAALTEILRSELGVGPDSQTEALYRDILLGPMTATTSAPELQPDLHPVVAVMPLANLSNDPALSAICEGLAEDVVTGLGRFRQLRVIDRNSSMTAAKRTEDSAELGKLLGASHIVQGSLQRDAAQIKTTIRLVEAASRSQLWADQFVCPADDLPSLPNRLSSTIVVKLQSRMELSLMDRAQRKTSLAAYDCVLRGIRHLRSYGPDDNTLAITWFDKALALDPGYPLARGYRGYADVVLHNYDNAPLHVLMAAKATIQDAIADDPEDSRLHWMLAMTCGDMLDFQSEERAYLRGLEVNPNDANLQCTYGFYCCISGRFDEGIGRIRDAMRLNPYHPEWYWVDLGTSFIAAGRFEDALEAYSHRANPKPFVLSRVACCLAHLDRIEEAGRVRDQILQLQPDFRIRDHRVAFPNNRLKEVIREGMRRAGLPP